MRLMHPPDTDAGLRRVEAARYALLRRLALAMRDQMVAHLHPIGVATQVMERRLRHDTPDVGRIGDDMRRLRGFASTAVAVNLDVVTWVSPEPGEQVALGSGVRECVEMLRGHFGFCGFELAHGGESTEPVSRHSVRTLVSAVLFALADEAPAPAGFTLRTDGRQVDVEVTASTGVVAATLPPYRLLGWDELQVLAAAEGVGVTRSGNGARLRFG